MKRHDYINTTQTQWHKHQVGTIQTPTGERLLTLYVHTYGNLRNQVRVYTKQHRGQLVPIQ
jgi:hypothetical protein